MTTSYMFTSESVTDGHPDKLCDQISDAIVGRILRQDRAAAVVAECAISTGIVFVAARIGSEASLDISNTARHVIRAAGYDQDGFNVRDCTVMTSVTHPNQSQSGTMEEEPEEADPDSMLVQDQATVFGYACDHTAALMPMPIWLAHKLARRLREVRREGILPYLTPDGKTQVGVEFRNRRPARLHSLSVVAAQREAEQPGASQVREELIEHVVRPTFEEESVAPDRDTHIFINPGGPVVLGGPAVHSGMTGRKTAVDTYGEFSRCSASALSGKDPTRVDRVGNYAARHAAKNIVAAGLARECEIQLSYSIGLPGPVSVQVDTFGTSEVAAEQIDRLIAEHFDFRLASILRRFRLRDLPSTDEEGFFEKLAAFGHVGRTDLDLPWETTDAVEQLKA